jgi:hypothetical protein
VHPDPASPFLARPARQKQLSLFPDVIRSAHLVAAGSPKKAFYRIRIEVNAGLFSVFKESGAEGRVLDRRRWPVDTLDQAVKMFDRIIKAKTNPERKSPRKYRLINRVRNG